MKNADPHKKELEQDRSDYAMNELKRAGFDARRTDINSEIIYVHHKGTIIRFYPYTGWHTGKLIKDGRGFKNLLKQLK